MDSYLIVDVNDTFTKAVLIEKEDGGFELRGVGKSPTTVQVPDLDVTVGIKNAIRRLEDDSGIVLSQSKKFGKIKNDVTGRGDKFLCSSSSGGGLHMIVVGIIGMISAESAQRAALGAGSLLMDVFSLDDKRENYERVEKMRSLRPDVLLLAGGTDGGAVVQVIGLTQLIKDSDLRPRLGKEFRLPVIYAGNVDIRKEVEEILSINHFTLKMVPNVRPEIERENLGPAKESIYDAFMEHILVHSPGYLKLVDLVDDPIIPTPAAVGEILYDCSKEYGVNLVGVNIGEATTDVYSVFDGIFNRSLNAELGMTYTVGNIMKEAGIDNVIRWIPLDIEEKEVRNIIGNMMIHLGDPSSPEEILVQHALAREAIRLGIKQHKTIASKLKGVKRIVPLEEKLAWLRDWKGRFVLYDPMKINRVIGMGKMFSSSADMGVVALLLIDSIQPEGITDIMIDGLNIMPHLGMLSKLNREAAREILNTKTLKKLGTCIAPKGVSKEGAPVMRILIRKSGGEGVFEEAVFGDLKTIPLEATETVEVEISPTRRFNVGNGRGKKMSTSLTGGGMGLIIDARGRPLSKSGIERNLERWMKALDALPRARKIPPEGN